MKMIDANALANYANNQTVGITANDIMRFPTVDAEPVVKCKDCAFVDTLECPLNYIDKQRQIYTNRAPDWFCAEGRRKDELSET